MVDINYALSPRTNSADWYSFSGTRSQITGDFPDDSTTAIRSTFDGSGSTYSLRTGGADPGVTVEDKTFSASFVLRSSVAGATVRTYLQFAAASGVITGSHVQDVTLGAAGTWTVVTFEDKDAPAGSARIQAGASRLDDVPLVTDETLDITNMMINEGATALAFFDGDTPDEPARAYAWEGDAHFSRSIATPVTASPDLAAFPQIGSASIRLQYQPGNPAATLTAVLREDVNGTQPVRTLPDLLPDSDGLIFTDYEPALYGQVTYTAVVDADAPVVVRENLCPNPSFEYGLDGYGVLGQTNLTIESANPISGNQSMRWEYPNDSPDNWSYISTSGSMASANTLYLSMRVRPEFTGKMTFIFGYGGGGYVSHEPDVVAGVEQTIELEYTNATAFTTWVLRFGQGAATAVKGSSAVVDDVIVATTPGPYFDGDTPDGDLIYDWTGTAGSSTSTASRPAGVHNITTTTSLDVRKPWLFVPVQPQLSTPVDLITGYGATHASGSTVHEVIDRQDPLVTIRRLKKRRGTLQVWCPDHGAAQAVKEVYSQGQVVMMRQPTHEGLDMYHVAESVEVDPLEVDGGRTRWTVRVDYAEVQRPTAPLSGALGWTFDDVAADYASFNVLPQVFDTFDDLTIGPLE